MNQSKYTNFNPKNNPNVQKTDAKTAAPVASVEVPKTDHSWKAAEAAPAASPVVAPAPVQATPAASPAPIAAPAQDPTPAPVQAAATPAEKAGLAMVNEGGNSVVIATPHDMSHAVREPSALTGNLPETPAARGNGAAGPSTPAVQAKPADGATS